MYGLYLVGQGVVMFVAPSWFHKYVGPYGVENHHYTRDMATFSIALGLPCIAVVRQKRWLLPLLAAVTLQAVLHTVSHLIDIGRSHPAIYGPIEFWLSVGTSMLLGVTLYRGASQPRT